MAGPYLSPLGPQADLLTEYMFGRRRQVSVRFPFVSFSFPLRSFEDADTRGWQWVTRVTLSFPRVSLAPCPPAVSSWVSSLQIVLNCSYLKYEVHWSVNCTEILLIRDVTEPRGLIHYESLYVRKSSLIHCNLFCAECHFERVSRINNCNVLRLT